MSQKRLLLSLATAVALIFGVSSYSIATSSDEEATPRDLAAVQIPLAEAAPEKPDETLLLSATLPRGRDHKLGEYVNINVRTNKDAYLTVFVQNASGDTLVLFPNDRQKQNFVRANRDYGIPGANSNWGIQTVGPIGSWDLIKIVASTSPAPVAAPGKTVPANIYKKFTVAGAAVARELQIALNGPHAGNSQVRQLYVRTVPRAETN